VQLDGRFGGLAWRLLDLLDGAVYERAGDELAERGLYVRLPPWGAHLLRLESV
jgi:hypothetical protein